MNSYISNNLNNSLQRASARGIAFAVLLAAILAIAPTSFAQSGDAQSGDTQQGNAEPGDNVATQKAAAAAVAEGNWTDALALYEIRLGTNDVTKQDLSEAVKCLRQLNRVSEVDALLTKVAKRHSKSAEILSAIAESYHQTDHFGYEVAGLFHRGNQRGQNHGQTVQQVGELDRVRAIRLLVKAINLQEQSPEEYEGKGSRFFVYAQLARVLTESRQGRWSWRLQTLTDLETLPEPTVGWNRWGNGVASSDPPANAEGGPLLYEVPASWAAATSDGERWRWALQQQSLIADGDTLHSDIQYADFLFSQFGVQNLNRLGWTLSDNESGTEPSRFNLASLTDSETIAKLATGLSRFELPEGHRYLEIYRKHNQWQKLAEAYLMRTQRAKAAEMFNRAIQAEKNLRAKKRLEDRLAQIVEPWVEWKPTKTHPAGVEPMLSVTHRNVKEICFTAKAIDVPQLLADLKAKLQSNSKIEHYEHQIENLGWRLLQKNQSKYVGEQVAEWNATVEPAEDHADRTELIKAPLTQAGAYLVEVAAGESSKEQMVVWIADSVLVEKRTEQGPLYMMFDAVSGDPISGAQVELFGYRHRNDRPRAKQQVEVKQLTESTDSTGLAQLAQLSNDYTWLTTATTDNGRLAVLGFSHYWSQPRSPEKIGVKTMFLTDRPIYRPGDKVEFKAWIARPNYATEPDETESEYAHKAFKVELYDARGDKVWSEELTANQYGGIVGSYTLPEEGTLGNYRFQVTGFGGGTFRVEEYRKPEFEVSVSAPEKPIALGETFTATVHADYYFGSPVAQAKVSYKVMRTDSHSDWFPLGRWDWLYGKGYGWLGIDSAWHPGWSRWGCFGPSPYWWTRPSTPPEMVAEGEADLKPDGTFDLEIDTADAKARNPNHDYRYTITAEVTDASRRTIVGTASLLAAKSPLRSTIWLDRGHYEMGDTLSVSLSVRTPDGKPVAGKGRLRLLKLLPESDGTDLQTTDAEVEVQSWDLPSGSEGTADLKIKASEPGRYRLLYTSQAVEGFQSEAGTLFTIRGEGFDGSDFRFNALELIPDKQEYQPGDKVRLLVNVDKANALVALFVRPVDGVYGKPQMIHMEGKSQLIELDIAADDQPNFFVEGVTVADGKVHVIAKQLVVPPLPRVINVEVLPSSDVYLPGQEAELKVRLSSADGSPLIGEATIAIYDKSIDAIAGGGLSADIRKQFWDWRRNHHPATRDSLAKNERPVTLRGITKMQHLGLRWVNGNFSILRSMSSSENHPRPTMAMARSGPGGGVPEMAMAMSDGGDMDMAKAKEPGGSAEPTVAVRENFADTALWVGSVETDSNGLAEIPFTLPESLTAWRIRVWGMASGTRVGEGQAEVVTRKDLMVRLQMPRFLVATDEVTLSAIVNNYYSVPQTVKVRLEADGDALTLPSDVTKTVTIEAGGEARIDWLTIAKQEGLAKVRVIAIAQKTDAEAGSEGDVNSDSDKSSDNVIATDAMQLELPVLVHGAEIVESFSELLGPDDSLATFEIVVPEDRRPEASRLEFHYRPSLVGAMLDTLPYLIEYPHGCTEQTLNRFLPAAITQNVLQEMGADLNALKPKDGEEALGPNQMRKPIYSSEELQRVVVQGVRRLEEMQLSDGGWGWFSGFGERSSAHTTAVVVRGLLVAKANDVEVPEEILARGVQWLESHREQQLALLANCNDDGHAIDPDKKHKRQANNLDALVQLTLAKAGSFNSVLRDRLVDDRLKLSRYSLGLIGLSLHIEGTSLEDGPLRKVVLGDRDRLIRNLRQFVVTDEENQTAYLELGGGSWWYWYGSEFETHACFLKLLAATEPNGDLAPRIVKYLLNNRQEAARWSSTRDTALVVEAMADYQRAMQKEEASEEMQVEVWLDGKKRDSVRITPAQALLFDGHFSLEAEELATGRHTLELRKSSGGRLFVGGTLTNFSLEADLRAAGLEVKIERRMTKLTPVKSEGKTVDARGGVQTTTLQKYRRTNLPNLGEVQSGDLIEVELILTSKNDYEYLLIEDYKPAGFEPVEVRSGYNGNELGAYVEFRDEKVQFYARQLPRGTRSVRYRLRAETPGKFAALPAQVSAMYAPDLRGNSDEQRVVVKDHE